MCILILIIIPLHLTSFVFELEKKISHIINELVSTRLRKDILHEHEILGELHRESIDHQHFTASSSAAKSTWDFWCPNTLSLVLFAGMTLDKCIVLRIGMLTGCPICRESHPLCRLKNPTVN